MIACASNPLSTQDDVAAALVDQYGIPTFAIHGEDRDTYYSHLRAVLERRPTITMDDGADLVSLLHTEFANQADDVKASMEETTTGVIRLRAMAKDGALKIPVVAVNDAQTKHLFDNRYGTGQSTLDGIIRATGVLIAGSVVVVAGYGYSGRGIASRARGLGADVVVTEVDPIRALEAAMDGFRVMKMIDAAKVGDIFITATGDKHVLTSAHFTQMKDGAFLSNLGHFDIEIDVAYLNDAAKKVDRDVTRNIDAYHLSNGRIVYLLGEGRLVNLACAEGHPAQVMDMSFATQAMASEWAAKSHQMAVKVHEVPAREEEEIAAVKLAAMSIKIDTLTADSANTSRAGNPAPDRAAVMADGTEPLSAAPPPALSSARVLHYAVLDETVGFNSGHRLVFIDGKELGKVPCLAIYQKKKASKFLIYYCDSDWEPVGASQYDTVEAAKGRAERIYPRILSEMDRGSFHGGKCQALPGSRSLRPIFDAAFAARDRVRT